MDILDRKSPNWEIDFKITNTDSSGIVSGKQKTILGKEFNIQVKNLLY